VWHPSALAPVYPRIVPHPGRFHGDLLLQPSVNSSRPTTGFGNPLQPHHRLFYVTPCSAPENAVTIAAIPSIPWLLYADLKYYRWFSQPKLCRPRWVKLETKPPDWTVLTPPVSNMKTFDDSAILLLGACSNHGWFFVFNLALFKRGGKPDTQTDRSTSFTERKLVGVSSRVCRRIRHVPRADWVPFIIPCRCVVRVVSSPCTWSQAQPKGRTCEGRRTKVGFACSKRAFHVAWASVLSTAVDCALTVGVVAAEGPSLSPPPSPSSRFSASPPDVAYRWGQRAAPPGPKLNVVRLWGERHNQLGVSPGVAIFWRLRQPRTYGSKPSRCKWECEQCTRSVLRELGTRFAHRSIAPMRSQLCGFRWSVFSLKKARFCR